MIIAALQRFFSGHNFAFVLFLSGKFFLKLVPTTSFKRLKSCAMQFNPKELI
jgi:hypothetical protein